MPVEPPPSKWTFPDPARAADGEVIGLGGDLEPGTLLAAYRAGIFPMPLGRRRLAWWSPEPRGILPLDGLHFARRLRRSDRRFEIRVDTAFAEVVEACADPRRPGAWIDPAIRAAYVRLHRLGWAHSVEAWSADGELAGGLYGVAVGGLFAGESMFHRATDASRSRSSTSSSCSPPARAAPRPPPARDGFSTCSGAPSTSRASARWR